MDTPRVDADHRFSIHGTSGHKSSPVSYTELFQKAKDGSIAPTTTITDEIDGRTFMAAEHPALMAIFKKHGVPATKNHPQQSRVKPYGVNEVDVPASETTKQTAGCMSLVLYIVGFALCLTGIGIVVGAPLIYIAWKSERETKNEVRRMIQSNCPYCDLLLNVPLTAVGANCPACAKRFLVRDGKFLKIDP